ncbi:hypothetical protein GQ457_06G022430 [Hibiscus cannabinus]
MSSGNVVPSQVGNLSKENRHLANFVPDVWGDTFLAPPPQLDMDDITRSEYQELKEQVRRMLMTYMDDNPSQKLDLIDEVQRLGVAYHFQKEIEDALQIIHLHHCNHTQIDDDLYTTAVRFRLLREHGFHVDSETLNKFKDEEGDFKKSLISDVKGMLQLYEAEHFQLHGEIILGEALSFTNFHLKLAETKVDYPLSTQIANALNRPLRKSLPRLVARSFISIYQGYGTQNQNLLKFVKLDFKIVQHLHRKEINELTRWNINCIDQLPDYMKVWFREVLKVFKDMKDLMSKEEKEYCVQFAIKVMKQQSEVYFAEAKWLHENYIPMMEEYMPVALISTGYLNATIASFVAMNDTITKDTFIWAFNVPKILRASSAICRLMDDMMLKQADATVIHVDNKSAIELAKDLVNHERSKHIDVRFHFIRDHVKGGNVELVHVASQDQVADIFTKPLPKVLLDKCKKMIGMMDAVECYMNQYGASMQAAYEELFKQVNDACNSDGVLSMVHSIGEVLNRPWCVRFSHIARDGNHAADWMAKLASSDDLLCHRYLSPPFSLRSYLSKENADFGPSFGQSSANGGMLWRRSMHNSGHFKALFSGPIVIVGADFVELATVKVALEIFIESKWSTKDLLVVESVFPSVCLRFSGQIFHDRFACKAGHSQKRVFQGLVVATSGNTD